MTDESRLIDEDLERASIEWLGIEQTRQQTGRLAASMAESAWAAEWAERFMDEVRRLRAEEQPGR